MVWRDMFACLLNFYRESFGCYSKCVKFPFVYFSRHEIFIGSTLMGCFQFTADMGSLEFSNQETEYKLRRGMSASKTLLVIQGSYEQVILQQYSFIIS